MTWNVDGARGELLEQIRRPVMLDVEHYVFYSLKLGDAAVAVYSLDLFILQGVTVNGRDIGHTCLPSRNPDQKILY